MKKAKKKYKPGELIRKGKIGSLKFEIRQSELKKGDLRYLEKNIK